MSRLLSSPRSKLTFLRRRCNSQRVKSNSLVRAEGVSNIPEHTRTPSEMPVPSVTEYLTQHCTIPVYSMPVSAFFNTTMPKQGKKVSQVLLKSGLGILGFQRRVIWASSTELRGWEAFQDHGITQNT